MIMIISSKIHILFIKICIPNQLPVSRFQIILHVPKLLRVGSHIPVPLVKSNDASFIVFQAMESSPRIFLDNCNVNAKRSFVSLLKNTLLSGKRRGLILTITPIISIKNFVKGVHYSTL